MKSVKNIVLGAVVIIAILGMLFLYYQFQSPNQIFVLNTEEKSTDVALPSPTPSLAISKEDFISLDNLNTVLPEDVLSEVSYFSGGAGCEDNCYCEGQNFQSPVIINAERLDVVEIYYPADFNLCGMAPDEIVSVDVVSPDGKKSNYQHPVSDTFKYIPKLGEPLGVYVINFIGNDWSLSHEIEVVDADGPRLYYADNKKVSLYKFYPNEKVRLLVFEGTKVIGWQEVAVDQFGKLTLEDQTPVSERRTFAALGEISGQILAINEGLDGFFSWSFGVDLVCDGVKKTSGIVPLGYAEILVDNLQTFTFSYPTASGEKLWENADLVNIPIGTIVYIKENQTCFDGKFLWHITCQFNACDDIYISDQGEDGFYLKPIESLDHDTYMKTFYQCSSSALSRLHTGQFGQVAFSDGLPINVRKSPGLSSEVLTAMSEGSKFVVLADPQCLDGFIWWKVDFGNGLIGWVAEGDKDSYFIEPLET